jgi:excisionase family DNA binding protein
MPLHETEGYVEPRPLLKARRVAALLDVDRTTVYRLAKSGALPFVIVGTRMRFRPEDIDRYLDRGAP